MGRVSKAIGRRAQDLLRETRGSLGRKHSARKLADSLSPGALLHLGCGPVHLPGWLDIDIDASVRPDLRLDLRYGLPAPPGTAAFIYSEHVLEHLSLDTGKRLLADCCRSLEPGGILRIAMPDLGDLVDHYRGDWRGQPWLSDPVYSHIDSPAYMLNYAMREWGHLYLYDRNELHRRLQEAGFVSVEDRSLGESPHPELQGLESREESLLIVEASAP